MNGMWSPKNSLTSLILNVMPFEAYMVVFFAVLDFALLWKFGEKNHKFNDGLKNIDPHPPFEEKCLFFPFFHTIL